MTPNEDYTNTDAILASLRARIATLESERSDYDTAIEAAHEAARQLQAKLDAVRIEAREDEAACDSLAETVNRIARQRDDMDHAFHATATVLAETRAALADMTLQRDELLRAVKAWHGDEKYGLAIGYKLIDALTYCEKFTPADRARDALNRDGQQAAAD